MSPTNAQPAQPMAYSADPRPWQVEVSGNIFGRETTVADSIKTGMLFTDWERDVRIIAPNGMRLSVVAASLLL